MHILIIGLAMIIFAFRYLNKAIKCLNPPEKNWGRTIATILDERKIELKEISTDELGARELKIVYYVAGKQYTKYIVRKNWQVGEEQEVYIKYNSDNPNIFEEVNDLRETYGNTNKYAIIFMFGAFIMFFIAGLACMINYN